MKNARRGFSTKALLICLAIVIGLVAFPAQAIYCAFFSGKSVEEHKIVVGEPIGLQLSPKMNPIRLIATIDYERPRIVNRFSNSTFYQATLRTEQSECWTKRFGVKVDDDDDRSGTGGTGITFHSNKPRPATTVQSIHSFDVESSEEYSFLVSPTDKNRIKVNNIAVTVRQNVRQTNVPVAIFGGITLVLGLITGFFSLIFKQPKLDIPT